MSVQAPDSTLVIRWLSAQDADLAQVATELNASDSEISIKGFSESSLRDFLGSGNRFYVAAYVNDTLAGATHGYRLLHPTGITYWYIDEVDTLVAYRRQGVATAMMKAVLEAAAADGANEVWLGADDDNPDAKAFYQTLKPTEVDDGTIYSWKVKQ